MSLSAVIFCDSRAAVVVAGLSLLDRLVITLHRAGCSPIRLEGSPPEAALAHSRELGMEIERVAPAEEIPGPALVARSSVLVNLEDVRRLVASGGRLVDSRGKPLPLGVAAASPRDPQASLAGAPEVVARGLAVEVATPREAREAEEALWRSFASPTDGLADRYLNRPLVLPLVRALARTRVPPNGVSVVSIAAGLAGAGSFAAGTFWGGLWGAILFQLSAAIDCADGHLARALFKESRLGKWLDFAGDQVVHVAIFAGIALGMARSGGLLAPALLGGSAVLGVVLSALVLARANSREAPGRLTSLLERAANRDFSVLLLAVAAAGRVNAFLWVAAVAVHLFWILGLVALRREGGLERGSLAGRVP